MDRDPEKIRFVIDTNILIGALVKDNSFKAKLLKKQNFLFYFPDYDHGLRGQENPYL